MITNSIVEQYMLYIFSNINWSNMMGVGAGGVFRIGIPRPHRSGDA
jgi:hypothetical protein